MKTQFKYFLLLLITSVYSNSQELRNIVSKSVTADKNTSVIFNLKNTAVTIEESTDGKVHFSYFLEFEGYSKKQIEKKLKEIKVDIVNNDNIITLKANSDVGIQLVNLSINDNSKLMLLPFPSNQKKEDSIIRVSKDSLLKVIKINNRPDTKNPLEDYENILKSNSRNNMYNEVSKNKVDVLRSKFVIRIPPFLKLNINAENSWIYIRDNLQNELSVNQKGGLFRAKELNNRFNSFKLSKLISFEAEKILGGDYIFNTIYSGKIGNIAKAKIISEFSKIKIGEIGRNTTITDFNSEYWFYNWSKDFERFNLYSEYSKIHFFYPQRNHSFKVIGNTTKNLLGSGEFVINMQPTSKGEKYTMMTKEPHPGEKLSGRIFFDIVHGIIYSHNDSIKKINN